MQSSTPRRRVGAAAVAIAAVLSLAAPIAGADTSALPAVQEQGAVRFLSGGIGLNESTAIKAEAARYPLALTFVKRIRGREAFVASVEVSIHDAAGLAVLETVAEGPYLLADLPPGSYRVSATLAGQQKTATVKIAADAHVARAFIWEAGAEELSAEAERAQAEAASRAAEQREALPPLVTDRGVPYRTGGVGQAESDALRADMANHSLSMTFASDNNGRNGFLAAVAVVIRDADGATVLETVSEGPYLLVDLPAGSYRIAAMYRDIGKFSTVQVVAGKPVKQVFVWRVGED